MKLKLPRRRCLVVAGCIAVIGCGLVLMHVEEAHRRYQRMLASYERVRIGMTSSEVRAEVAQPLADDKAWHDTLFFEHWKVMKAEEAPAEGQENKSWDNHDDWLD